MANCPVKSKNPIFYLVPDLSDPATSKRLEMFRLGGAEFSVFGFDRRPNVQKNFSYTSLGITRDAALFQRVISVMKAMLKLSSLLRSSSESDVIIARNLEMLLIANIIMHSSRKRGTKLIYECLDLHRILLEGSFVGKLLRMIENCLLKNVNTIIISSEAFFNEYFSAIHQYDGDVLHVENKILLSTSSTDRIEVRNYEDLCIGYFGMLRCRKSLKILQTIADRSTNLRQIVLAGIPSPAIFPRFREDILPFEKICYSGPYTSKGIAELYGRVDFSWCIDFFEEGLNSKLLLPNRLYESLAFGVIPIAIKGTETGRWLEKRKIGKVFSNTDQIEAYFSNLDREEVISLKRDIAHLSKKYYAFSDADCKSLVRDIYSVKYDLR